MKIRLTHNALDDLDMLLLNEAERAGWDRSMDVEGQLWRDFEKLARTPGIGHHRQDITAAAVYFYYSEPYMIVYRPDNSQLTILGVIHGARDIAAILGDRSPE